MTTRHLPTLAYNGLTIVLDKPSRFDHEGLMTGQAGALFDNVLRLPKQACDVRVWATLGEGWLPGTKVVMLLGESYRSQRQDATLSQLRGSPWVGSDGIIYIASYHPQDALDRKDYFDGADEAASSSDDDKSTSGQTKRVNWMFWLKQDLKKTRELLGGLAVVPDAEMEIPLATTAEELLLRTKGQKMALDIETDSLFRLTCVGFKFESTAPQVLPMWQTHAASLGYFYGHADTLRLLRALAVAMRDNTVIIHNAMFDLFVLAWRYGIPPGRSIIDTMLLHHRCHPEVEKSLGHCLSLYTHQPYHKNEGVFEPRNLSEAGQLYRYNAKDVQALEILEPRMWKVAEQLGATDSAQAAMTMIHPYLTAMLQGLRVNVPAIQNRVAANLRKIEQLKRIINIACGYPVNPQSPKQVASYLYDKRFGMGYKRPAKDPTNEKNLLMLTLQHNNPALRTFLEYRRLGKENGALKFNLWAGPTVLHNHDRPRTTTSYRLAGTTTFRLASSKLFRTYGGNLQNISKDLRKMVIPDDGKVFVQVDQSGAEALIVAYLCENRSLRKLFLNGIKPHTFVAMHLFRKAWEDELGFSLHDYVTADVEALRHLPQWGDLNEIIKASDDWPAHKRYYFIAKMVQHASSYGMKGPTFRANVMQKSEGRVVLSLADAVMFLQKFHALFPEIRHWQQDVITQIHKNRTLENLFGHPRQFTNPHLDDSVYKEAFAFVPQSTVGMITNFAFVELQQQIEQGMLPLGTDILQNNHDSVLLQCPDNPQAITEVVMAAQRALNRTMQSPRGGVVFDEVGGVVWA